jgi:CheY-like chemotaxis protein
MKIDYKILWLDDKMNEILDEEYPNEIRTFLINQGFEPSIVPVKNEKEFFEALDDSFDLILTDYHLNETTSNTRNGDAIIEEVRNKSIFTEIMFYSAQGDLADTVKKDRITFFDTGRIIGNIHYDKIVKKAISLIALTIKKFQHVVVMRGMIMNETSSLDMQMLEIIKLALKSEEINFDELAPKIYDELNELYNSKNEFVNKCRKDSKFLTLTKDNFVFSAEYKIKTLREILGNLDIADFSEEYKEEINSMRNKFAHAILLKDEKTGREYFQHGESGLTFDEDLCKRIRTDIVKHRKNFDNTIAKIKKPNS